MAHEPAENTETTGKEHALFQNPTGNPEAPSSAEPQYEPDSPQQGSIDTGKARPDTAPDDPDRAPAPQSLYLKSILDKAVDPESLKAIMRDIGFEKTIITSEAAKISTHSCFRVQEIGGVPYILCPVPFLYDEKRNIEAGFAVDVDQDHFDVYAYMHNYSTKESFAIPKLAHCVHRAIMLDASDYSRISDEVKQISNEASAVFFVNSLVADIAMKHVSPIEFFEDKLYMQLLTRLVRVSEPKWINQTAIGKKFEQVMDQFKALDPEDSFYENNKRRIFLNLIQFFDGAIDLVPTGHFPRYLEPGTVKRYQHTIQAYLETGEFAQSLIDFPRYSKPPLRALLEMFARGGVKASNGFLTNILAAFRKRGENNRGLEGIVDLISVGRQPSYLPVFQEPRALQG